MKYSILCHSYILTFQLIISSISFELRYKRAGKQKQEKPIYLKYICSFHNTSAVLMKKFPIWDYLHSCHSRNLSSGRRSRKVVVFGDFYLGLEQSGETVATCRLIRKMIWPPPWSISKRVHDFKFNNQSPWKWVWVVTGRRRDNKWDQPLIHHFMLYNTLLLIKMPPTILQLWEDQTVPLLHWEIIVWVQWVHCQAAHQFLDLE